MAACREVRQPPSDDELDALHQAYIRAFEEYSTEIRKTITLLGVPVKGIDIQAFAAQRARESEAFERYQAARREYFKGLERAGR